MRYAAKSGELSRISIKAAVYYITVSRYDSILRLDICPEWDPAWITWHVFSISGFHEGDLCTA